MVNQQAENIPERKPTKPTLWLSVKPALLVTLTIIAGWILFMTIYYRFFNSPSAGLLFGPLMSALFIIIIIPIAIIIWKKVR